MNTLSMLPGEGTPYRKAHTADFLDAGDTDTRLTVSAWIGDDGALVIQLDTTEHDQHVRVYVNDGSVFDQNTETGEDFGDEAHGGGL